MESARWPSGRQSLPKPARRHIPSACLAVAIVAVGHAMAAELIYQEGFNDDGEAATPKRYTTTGRFTSEVPHDPGLVASSGDQVGPVYWAHRSEVSIVGVYGPTPERRALLAWDAAIQEEDVSPQFWTLFDATIHWLLRGKASATVLISADSTSAQSLADRLATRGHTVVDDDISIPDSAVVADLIIKTPNNLGTPGRFARTGKPLLTFSALDHDDLLVSTIGATATFEAGNGTVVDAAHPAAGGLTGSFPVATGSYTWQLVGDNLPGGAITVATLSRSIPPTAASLADVDAMIAGSKPSDRSEETVDTLDFSDASPGDWFWDYPVPGGATGVWGLQARGQIQVTANGTYSFALGMDDGARLRIDRDGNGFSEADNVIVEDAAGGHRARYGTVQLNTGTYPFEVVAFNSGGGGSLELSVSTETGAPDTSPISSGTWELLGETSGNVRLQGAITAASYVPTGDAETVTVPLLVLLNGPEDSPAGSVYGGGAFTGYEGTGFFAGAALNKFDSDGSGTTKTLTLPPVNVAGKENVRVTFAAAATFLDFETDDFLDLWIDPNNSGNFSQLVRFTAPSGNDKYFDDRLTNPSNPTQLGLAFKDVTYPIPQGATDLVIQIRAFTTWFNEIVAFDDIRITAGDQLRIGSIALAQDTVTITWTGAGRLQSAPDVNGPFSDVAGASSPHAVQVSAAERRYYRLVQ
ncbi:MAG: hypothetical protein KF833_11740 [Verrucomicrobiae bacterium]|nr:hypothetical protein [Verrucomicrobiae bacterium]